MMRFHDWMSYLSCMTHCRTQWITGPFLLSHYSQSPTLIKTAIPYKEASLVTQNWAESRSTNREGRCAWPSPGGFLVMKLLSNNLQEIVVFLRLVPDHRCLKILATMFVLPHVGSSPCRRKEDCLWKTGRGGTQLQHGVLGVRLHRPESWCPSGHIEKMSVSAYLPRKPDVSIRWNLESERVVFSDLSGRIFISVDINLIQTKYVFFSPWRLGHLWTVCFKEVICCCCEPCPSHINAWSLIPARGLSTLPFSLGLPPLRPH